MMSQETQFNPVIKAVQSLRKLALEVNNDNNEIRTLEEGIIKKLEEAGKMIISINDNSVTTLWLAEKSKLESNIKHLLEFLKNIESKFKSQDTSNITALFDGKDEYRSAVITGLNEMKKMGEVLFNGEKFGEWNKIWDEISDYHAKILSYKEIYTLKLKMIESLTPEEIDSLTSDVLKHIPLDYSDEEAQKYEQEYVKAFNDLKEEQSKKKNVWDKILDILAGGIQETPAHRVQMTRWLEGELH